MLTETLLAKIHDQHRRFETAVASLQSEVAALSEQKREDEEKTRAVRQAADAERAARGLVRSTRTVESPQRNSTISSEPGRLAKPESKPSALKRGLQLV